MLASSVLQVRRPQGVSLGVLSLALACGLAACAQGSTLEATSSASGGASSAGSAGSAGAASGASGNGGAAGNGANGGAAGALGNGGAAGSAGASGSASGSAGAGASGSGSGSGFVESACAPGEFATGVDLGQKLACVPIAPLARDAVNNGCSFYMGWRDKCTECTLDPSKWGHTSPAGCANGTGVNDTCTTPMLDGVAINMFGLNFDGNVNDDDKIHLGLDCPAGDASMAPGPCKMGALATGIAGDGAATCVSAAAPVLERVRSSCSFYFGWRDSCDACTSAPARWGRVSPTDCAVGLGNTSTCTKPTLAGKAVNLFGLSAGGDVDGNDKLYLALRCEDAMADSVKVKDACPPGHLITGLLADGTLTCEDPAKAVADYFDAHCTFYFGWRDSCDGCMTAPAKWGRVRNGFCTADLGSDDTCAATVLDGKTLQMFGLNTDGDVDDDDKLYVGFRCE